MSIFGRKPKEGVLAKLVTKQQKQELKEARVRERKGKRAQELRERTEKAKAEASYYKAQAERKKAKKATSFQWPAVKTPKVKIKKKRQGKPLSRKRRIGLI